MRTQISGILHKSIYRVEDEHHTHAPGGDLNHQSRDLKSSARTTELQSLHESIQSEKQSSNCMKDDHHIYASDRDLNPKSRD